MRPSNADADSGCHGKQSYLTWDAARRVIEAMRRQARQGRGRMTPYRCRHCNSWHIGHGE